MNWAVTYWVDDYAAVVGTFDSEQEALAWMDENVDLDADEMENMGIQVARILPPTPWPPEIHVPIPVPPLVAG